MSQTPTSLTRKSKEMQDRYDSVKKLYSKHYHISEIAQRLGWSRRVIAYEISKVKQEALTTAMDSIVESTAIERERILTNLQEQRHNVWVRIDAANLTAT